MLLFASVVTFGLTLSWLPLSVTAATTANATALALSEKFTLFSWSTINNDVTIADQLFAFHLDKPAVLQLIDYKQPGDIFQLFDNGRILGKTIRPTLTVPQEEEQEAYAETPELALADVHQRFSKGQVLLSQGHHLITIKVLESSANPTSSGGAIRLIEAPMKLQQFYKHYHHDDDDDDDDDDNDNDNDDDDDDEDDKGYDDDDYYHYYKHRDYDDDDDDEYDYTVTLTVVVPPKTPDLWRHRTEPIVTMMPAPAGLQGRESVLPVLYDIREELTAVTFIPPAGREYRNPMAGYRRF